MKTITEYIQKKQISVEKYVTPKSIEDLKVGMYYNIEFKDGSIYASKCIRESKFNMWEITICIKYGNVYFNNIDKQATDIKFLPIDRNYIELLDGIEDWIKDKPINEFKTIGNIKNNKFVPKL